MSDPTCKYDFKLGDLVTYIAGIDGINADDIAQNAYFGKIIELPDNYKDGGPYHPLIRVERISDGLNGLNMSKAGKQFPSYAYTFEPLTPAATCAPFATEQAVGDPKKDTGAPDTCEINGKVYEGWSVFNDSGFKVVSSKGQFIVNRPGVNDFQSLNPVP